MKKALFSIFTVCALFACNKVEKEAPVQEQGTPVTFNITVSGTDDTKAVKSAWATGDVINIFFEGLEAKYLCITYNSEATPKWAVSMPNGAISAPEFAALGTKELTAVHTPASVTVAWDGVNNKFTFTDNSTNTIKPIYNYYLLEEDKAYTVDGTTVNVTLTMGKPANYVWFFVDGISADVDQYYLKEPNLTPTAPASVALGGGVTETTSTAGYPLAGVALSTGGIYAAKVASQSTYAFQLVKVNAAADMIATRTYTKSGTFAFEEGKQYNLGSYSAMTENKWVDLGFASANVLWATGNLMDDGSDSNGGSIVEFNQFGYWYAWGETKQRTPDSGTGQSSRWTAVEKQFILDNAPFYNSATSTWTKYYAGDGGDYILDPEDDAAYVQLDGLHTGWRMPSSSEITNLKNNGVVDETRGYGFLVTGPNNLKLFLPNAGYGLNYYVNSGLGSYTTRNYSAGTTRVNVTRLYFRKGEFDTAGANRDHGHSIRPVKPVGY